MIDELKIFLVNDVYTVEFFLVCLVEIKHDFPKKSVVRILKEYLLDDAFVTLYQEIRLENFDSFKPVTILLNKIKQQSL